MKKSWFYDRLPSGGLDLIQHQQMTPKGTLKWKVYIHIKTYCINALN